MHGDRFVMVGACSVCVCMRENRAVLSAHPHDDCVTGARRTSNRRINLFRIDCTVHLKSTRNKVVTSVVVLAGQVQVIMLASHVNLCVCVLFFFPCGSVSIETVVRVTRGT